MVDKKYLEQSELKRKEMKAEQKRAFKKIGKDSRENRKRNTPFGRAMASFEEELSKAQTRAERKRLWRQWRMVRDNFPKY